jgi:hypothetical protein
MKKSQSFSTVEADFDKLQRMIEEVRPSYEAAADALADPGSFGRWRCWA